MSDPVKHLYARAAFGLSPREWEKRHTNSPAREVEALFKDSRKVEKLEVVSSKAVKSKGMSKEERKQFRKEQRALMSELNHRWFSRMASGEGALRERSTLFWHGHFACRVENVFAAQQLNNEIRQHALGNFKDLLLAVSRSPAMLQFLNNQQNRKAHPNENFARELLELFTLGRGKYSETDIKEAARAFTGWGFNGEGDFVFRQRQHDFGGKQFMGKQGEFGGEEIIDIILKRKDCARFICRKLYRYFVNPAVNEGDLEELSTHFYESGYDLESLIRRMFSADFFYRAEHLGAKIKSPCDLLVGLMRQLDLSFEEKRPLMGLQKVLGQVLFRPPNVAGWPGNTNWIDSSRIMARMALPSYLIEGAEFRYEAAADDDAGEPSFKRFGKSGKLPGSEVHWGVMEKVFSASSDIKLRQSLAGYFLALPLDKVNLDPVQIPSGGNSLKSLSLQILSLPEYQLC